MLLKCSSVGILRKSIQSSCSTTYLVSLFVGNSLLLFFLFHNYYITMLTRCVRWNRLLLLWNIVSSSVNVVHLLLVELHFLLFFLFHNDVSFKLFNNSVAKLRNKIENDETKREKFSNRDKNITKIYRISNNQGNHTLLSHDRCWWCRAMTFLSPKCHKSDSMSHSLFHTLVGHVDVSSSVLTALSERKEV